MSDDTIERARRMTPGLRTATQEALLAEHKVREQAERERDGWKQRYYTAHDNLLRYGQHDTDCRIDDDAGVPCNCGRDAALREQDSPAPLSAEAKAAIYDAVASGVLRSCPTCGSDDPKKCAVEGAFHYPCCKNPWHSAPPVEEGK